MASTDARAVPLKNTAFRVTFPIYKSDGTLITGAAGLDSEVSIDGGNWADCAAEATEIQSSGIYYLDLSAAEMNGDTIAVVVKTSATGAAIPSFIFYPSANALGTLTASERTSVADTLLNRDMSAVSDSNARSPLNALRFLRNKWSLSGTTLTVAKENDTDAAWTAAVTTNEAAVPITGSDPA